MTTKKVKIYNTEDMVKCIVYNHYKNDVVLVIYLNDINQCKNLIDKLKDSYDLDTLDIIQDIMMIVFNNVKGACNICDLYKHKNGEYPYMQVYVKGNYEYENV
jgi:hypothetical protein